MKKRIGEYAYRLDLGKIRVSNEDNATALINSNGDVLLIVCDGMGGYKKGDFASRVVIEHFKDAFLNKTHFLTNYTAIQWIMSVAKKANREIFKNAQDQDYKDMGTTCIIALLVNDSIIVAYAGDSRCYFYSKNKMEQISEDQTYVDYLYKNGTIKKEEMATHPKRHVLTNAIGIFPTVSLSFKTFKNKGQNILLCSDGLYKNLEESDILSVLKSNEAVDVKCESLIAFANSNGGSDNIATVLWESKDD
ncbi:MAG: Stp1/IreP family PP2C-type Ser/Thr phosphatase [Bacilli bacterium]